MAKIIKTSKLSVADIMKQKKLEQKKILQEKAAAIKAAKELEFDTFVRNTAKDILKDCKAKCRLQVFNSNSATNFIDNSCSSESSIWAPWSRLSGK